MKILLIDIISAFVILFKIDFNFLYDSDAVFISEDSTLL